MYPKRLGALKHVHKFGSNSGLSASAETVWSVGGLYDYIPSAQVLYVSSTENADNGTVELEGVGENYVLQTETVSLDGSPSQITTTKTWLRVWRMKYSNGSGGNTGVITARRTSHAGTIQAQIDIGESQTLMALYTIPANYVGYLKQYHCGIGKNDDATIFLYTKENGNVFRVKSEISLYQNSYVQNFEPALTIPEYADIEFRAIGSNASGSLCTVNFDLYLYKARR